MLLGDGAGGFAHQARYPAGDGPFGLAAADIDGDGNLDLATGDYYAESVAVLHGDGMGRFGPPMHVPLGLPYPGPVVIGDLDRDGVADLVVGHCRDSDLPIGRVSVVRGDGHGGFSPARHLVAPGCPFSLALDDFNRDSSPDILVGTPMLGGGLMLLRGDGAGGFTASAPPTRESPGVVATADVNADSATDIVTAIRYGGNIGVLLGDGAGGFGAARYFDNGTDRPYWLALGELTGDDRIDAAVANDLEDTVSLMAGDGEGGFGPPTKLGVGDQPLDVQLADLNNDGHLDVVTANANASAEDVSVLLNCGGPDAAPAPVAGDDAAEAAEDTPIVIPTSDLLDDDTDPEGDVLTVTGISATATTHGTCRRPTAR